MASTVHGRRMIQFHFRDEWVERDRSLFFQCQGAALRSRIEIQPQDNSPMSQGMHPVNLTYWRYPLHCKPPSDRLVLIIVTENHSQAKNERSSLHLLSRTMHRALRYTHSRLEITEDSICRSHSGRGHIPHSALHWPLARRGACWSFVTGGRTNIVVGAMDGPLHTAETAATTHRVWTPAQRNRPSIQLHYAKCAQ